MWSASVKIALDAPEIPLGIEEIQPGCKKKVLQCALILFGPLTVLLVRLQYEMTLKKFERVQELQNEHLFNEFNHLSSRSKILENHKNDTVKAEIAFEITNQIFMNIFLVLLSTSQTKTSSAFEGLFRTDGQGMFGIPTVTIYIFSTILGFVSFIYSSVTVNVKHWSWKSKLLFGTYVLISFTLRLSGQLIFFIPSLGISNVLRHHQSDQFPFDFDRSYQKLLMTNNVTDGMIQYGNAPPVALADISHFDYTDPEHPTSTSHYTQYTGLTPKYSFIIFMCLWFAQIFCIWLKNYLTSKPFRNLSFYDQFIHSISSVFGPVPSVDWSVDEGTCAEHYKRMMETTKEVQGTITINAIFQSLHLLPVFYLGMFDKLHT